MRNETKKEIKELLGESDRYYVRGVNSLEDINRNSIDVFDEYLQGLSGGREGIEERLEECVNEYSLTEKGDDLIVEYSGSNITYGFDEMITDQYKYIAIVCGEIIGENFHADGDICNIENIVKVFEK